MSVQNVLPTRMSTTGMAAIAAVIVSISGIANSQCDCPTGTSELLSQPANYSYISASESGGPLPFVAADQVVLPAVDIGQLTISALGGFYHPTGTTGIDNNFTLVIRNDASGLPGTILYSETNISAIAAPTGNQIPDPPFIPGVDEYCVTITPITIQNIPAGTYWFEIFHNAASPNDLAWYWVAGDSDTTNGLPGAARSSASAPGSAWSAFPFDFAMNICQSSVDSHGLYTVADTNELMRVNVSTCTATAIGVTRDTPTGTVRRIRGLAYDTAHETLYGMTREGDLVTVDPLTAQTSFVTSIAGITGAPATEFWSGLSIESGVFEETLYTTSAFGGRELVQISLILPGHFPFAAVIGSTAHSSGSALQTLGVAMYPPTAPPTVGNPFLGSLYTANRSNMNISELDRLTGELTFPMGNHTMGVNNPQAITFHPETGVLYSIHDHSAGNNNAALATYDFTAEMATTICVLPFGIVESVGGGNDTYGWGGLAFIPN
ncbi:MAG: hypothetical protein ACI835_003645 [Planctomycetota bacterium]|jgi:hypothetical protein